MRIDAQSLEEVQRYLQEKGIPEERDLVEQFQKAVSSINFEGRARGRQCHVVADIHTPPSSSLLRIDFDARGVNEEEIGAFIGPDMPLNEACFSGRNTLRADILEEVERCFHDFIQYMNNQ